MTIQMATDLINHYEARNRVMVDPTMNLWARARALTAVDIAAALPAQSSKPSLSFGNIVTGGIAAGLGATVASGLGSLMGISGAAHQTITSMGGGLAGLIGSGIVQPTMFSKESAMHHDHQTYAAKLGFVTEAAHNGLLERSAAHIKLGGVPVDASVLTAPIAAVTGPLHRAGEGIGTLIGGLTGADDVDVDVAKLDAERADLEDRLAQLREQRHSSQLAALLARRNDSKVNRRTSFLSTA